MNLFNKLSVCSQTCHTNKNNNNDNDNKTGYLPVFHNGCNLKRVGLLGVESPAFPVDSLQSGRKQRHQPVGRSTTGRPDLIHAKASNNSGYSREKRRIWNMFCCLPRAQTNKNETNLNSKGFTLVILTNQIRV